MEESFIRLEIERKLSLLSLLNERYASAVRSDSVLSVKKEIRLQIKSITNELESLTEKLPQKDYLKSN